MEDHQPLFPSEQIDYSTLLSVVREQLKKFSHGNQPYSYQTACRYGPKDHDILTFEVRVLQKILDNIPHDTLAHRSLAELQVKNMALEQNISILKSQLNTLNTKHGKLGDELQEARIVISDKERKLAALMKKCEQFDRLGGKLKFDKVDHEARELSSKFAVLQISEKKAGDKVLGLQRQVKLQKELNGQQEGIIVDLQIENEGLNERIAKLERGQDQRQAKLKENVQAIANSAKSSDMESLALKQKIKEQSQLINNLRSEFETAKAHWLKKQQHYSKVVEKCFMKDQLL